MILIGSLKKMYYEIYLSYHIIQYAYQCTETYVNALQQLYQYPLLLWQLFDLFQCHYARDQ